MTGSSALREDSKRILLEICAGIALYSILGELIIFLLPLETVSAALAFLLGTALSAGSMVHITYVTELVLDMNSQKEAQKYTVSRYLLRMAVITAVILLVYFTKYLNMAALFIGLLGIKAGAYLQPFMNRFLECFMKRQLKKEGGE
ncbi:MAG: ATP synthase subunit I [Lachnospiraceae bacterium]|nr:ATP synthase subunit I [Lachnospiraceae bacterium]